MGTASEHRLKSGTSGSVAGLQERLLRERLRFNSHSDEEDQMSHCGYGAGRGRKDGRLRNIVLGLCVLGVAFTGLAVQGAAASVGLPGGRANYVVSVVGGSVDKYWVRTAQYTFTAGSGSHGTVVQSFWYWNMTTFKDATPTPNATTNKVLTGYTTSGCTSTCAIRTPRGFEPSAAPQTLSGIYYVDTFGRLVINWPNNQTEAWSMSNAGTYTKLTVHHSNFGILYGDGFGSKRSFSVGASRDVIATKSLSGTQRSSSYRQFPLTDSPWRIRFPADYASCSSSPCLFLTNTAWRSGFAIDPRTNGRRVYWENQKQGVDSCTAPCFCGGYGHTWALLQIIDDAGSFVGLTGVEASFNKRSPGNAVISQIVLK
jgi:hypothetical protein